MRVAFFLLCSFALRGQAILHEYGDDGLTGAYNTETHITRSNVGRMSQVCQLSVDGAVYAQPLYNSATDQVIISTMNNSVYSFSQSACGTAYQWKTHFESPRSSPMWETELYGENIGCLSTPAVDVTDGWIFSVCTNNTPTYVLRALSLSTGSVLASATITATVSGSGDSGDTVSGGNLTFYPTYELQRESLRWVNNKLYVGFGGMSDTHPWHGWLFAYSFNGSSFTQVNAVCLSHNGYGAAIWAGAPANDSSGNIYVTTGNGTFDSTDYAESYLKYDPSLTLLDRWTPSNESTLSTDDRDLSSNRIIIVGSYLISVAKDCNVNVQTTSSLGGTGGTLAQTFAVGSCPGSDSGATGSYGLLFMNNTLYVPINGDSLRAYAWGGSSFTTSPAATSSSTFSFPGPVMSGSNNNGSDGIVWAVTVPSSAEETAENATLRAFNSSTLAELWNDGGNVGHMAKFAPPTVANGRVFVATTDAVIDVYGLLPDSQSAGTISFRTIQQ